MRGRDPSLSRAEAHRSSTLPPAASSPLQPLSCVYVNAVQPQDRAASFGLAPECLHGALSWDRNMSDKETCTVYTVTEILGLFPPHSPANLTTLGLLPGAQPKTSPAVPGPSVSLQGWQEWGDGMYFARPVPLGFCSVPPPRVRSGVRPCPVLTRETIISVFFPFEKKFLFL